MKKVFFSVGLRESTQSGEADYIFLHLCEKIKEIVIKVKGVIQPFYLDVKGGEINTIAINAKGGDCWQYGSGRGCRLSLMAIKYDSYNKL